MFPENTIFVECNADEPLVRVLTGFNENIIKHSFNKNKVIKRIRGNPKTIALVDEDPNEADHPFLLSMIEQKEKSKHNIIFREAENGSISIILCPRLENWIIKIANDGDKDLEKFNLPNIPEKLHILINSRLDDFINFLNDVKDFPAIQHLKDLLDREN